MITSAKFRAIRALCGITQVDLAEKAGVSPTTVAEYELGKRDMNMGTLTKLFRVLGVDVSLKVGGVEMK